jgi:hypothetical protein
MWQDPEDAHDRRHPAQGARARLRLARGGSCRRGFLLKFVGLPLLAVLGVLALPVLILLLVIGLPIFVVLLVGGALLSLVGVLLTLGLAVAKIVIPIALAVMLVRWLLRDRSAPAAATDASASA